MYRTCTVFIFLQMAIPVKDCPDRPCPGGSTVSPVAALPCCCFFFFFFSSLPVMDCPWCPSPFCFFKPCCLPLQCRSTWYSPLLDWTSECTLLLVITAQNIPMHYSKVQYKKVGSDFVLQLSISLYPSVVLQRAHAVLPLSALLCLPCSSSWTRRQPSLAALLEGNTGHSSAMCVRVMYSTRRVLAIVQVVYHHCSRACFVARSC